MSENNPPGNEGPEYPDGKLNEEDEGAIQVGIGIDNGRVMIIWPKPITWIAYDPDGADEFADAIKEKAQMAREMGTPPLPEPVTSH